MSMMVPKSLAYGCARGFALGAFALVVPFAADAGPPINPTIPPAEVVYTDWGRIERLGSAWRADAMAVHHSAPFVNAQRGGGRVAECIRVNDGYATDPNDPGHKLHHAILIGAFLHNKQVRLLLQACVYDKPRIISVEVRD